MSPVQIYKKTIIQILFDLHVLINSGCFPIKGGMCDIKKLLNELFSQNKLDSSKVNETWKKVKNICYLRATNSSLAGLRNLFSKSNVFGPGRDPIVDLIYNAIANIGTNLQNSNSNIKNLFGLLNTHQKGRALFQLLPLATKEDVELINAIKKSLSFPHQTLNDLMQNEYKIFVSLYSPQKPADFPNKKSIILSRDNVKSNLNFNAYFIKPGETEVKRVSLFHRELPQELQKIHYHLLKAKKENDKEKDNKHHSHSVKEKRQTIKMTDIPFVSEERNKYDHIVMKCHNIYLNPGRCDVSESLKENRIYKQIASYAEKLVQTLIKSKLIKRVPRLIKSHLPPRELENHSSLRSIR